MTKKQSTKKGSTKGKAGSRKGSVKQRARAIIDDADRYDEETRHAIKNSLDDGDGDLAELVRCAESGETILDTSKLPRVLADEDAIVYVRTAYDAALSHYHAHKRDPFALSRLAVVYGEQQLVDFHMVVTLPGRGRWEGVGEDDIRDSVRDAESIARTLEDPECSEAYRKAFSSIFTDHLLNISGVKWEHPAIVRVLFPLIMIDLWGNRPADADTAREIISITLREALISEEVFERTHPANG